MKISGWVAIWGWQAIRIRLVGSVFVHLAAEKAGRKLDHFSWARKPEAILPFIL